MAEPVTKERVLDALKRVKGPDLAGDIVAQGLVSEIVIHKGKVYFAIQVDPARAGELEALRQAAERVVAAVPGVEAVTVTLTADRAPGGGNGGGQEAAGSPFTRPGAARDARHRPGGVPGVANIIAVASGKGGVGKSTTAVNLALALKDHGLRVGILDADIYGPSMPRLLGLKGQPQQISGNQLAPMEAYGLKVMSMGFLVDEETPMIWRGPMVMSALSQMLKDVAWGELDVLVVDMPPGTGDAALTLTQQAPLAGALIVTTANELSLIDARKGLLMFEKVQVPVLGIVENMSYFTPPDLPDRKYYIFGQGGGRRIAAELGVEFLGEVPIDPRVVEGGDKGRPILLDAPDAPAAVAFREIAGRVARRLAVLSTSKPPVADANITWVS